MLVTRTRIETTALDLTYAVARAIAHSHVTGVNLCAESGHALTAEQEIDILTARFVTFEGILAGVQQPKVHEETHWLVEGDSDLLPPTEQKGDGGVPTEDLQAVLTRVAERRERQEAKAQAQAEAAQGKAARDREDAEVRENS